VQILRKLVEKDILQSTRGVDGGYCLKRPPADVTLFEIVAALDNPLEPHDGALSDLTPLTRAKILDTLHLAAVGAQRELEKVSLADLLTNDKRNGVFDGQ
jgi:DNA-binding IscR family transcriptional regulator